MLGAAREPSRALSVLIKGSVVPVPHRNLLVVVVVRRHGVVAEVLVDVVADLVVGAVDLLTLAPLPM